MLFLYESIMKTPIETFTKATKSLEETHTYLSTMSACLSAHNKLKFASIMSCYSNLLLKKL